MTDPTPVSSFTTTTWVMFGTMALLIAYDIYKARSKEGGDTISEVTLSFWLRYPIILVLIGILVGHLTWPQYLPCP